MTASILATFELDANGRPRFIQRGNLKHYHIRLRSTAA